MLTVVVTTYIPQGDIGKRRFEYLFEAVYSLWEHLSGNECKLHIADDSEEPGLIDVSQFPLSLISYSNSRHRGIGASLNKALEHVSGNWMYTTDDWLLTNRLDVTSALKLLDYYKYDVVRVGPLHPNLGCTTRFNQDVGWWLDIHNGAFAFATRPFIATYDFYARTGKFMEQVDSYQCEVDYMKRAKGAKIAGIMEYHNIWEHLGEDYSVGLHERSFNNSTPNV